MKKFFKAKWLTTDIAKFYAIVCAIVIVAFSIAAISRKPSQEEVDSMYKATPGTPWTRDGFFVNLDTIDSTSIATTLCKATGRTELTARVEFTNFAGQGTVTIKYAEPLVSIFVIGHKNLIEKRGTELVTRKVPVGWGGAPGGYVWELMPLTIADLGPGEHKVVATAVFTLDLEPPYEWQRIVSNTVVIKVCSSH